MDEKKKIGILTLVIAIAGVLFAFIDALVSVSYGVIPSRPSADFVDLVVNGPLWWRINPVIVTTIISVAIIGYLIGGDKKLSERPISDFFGLGRVIITFVLISVSGLGDLMAQTFVEILTGNAPFYWLYREWWWTRFMPFPAVVTFLMGRNAPLGTDMLMASIIGIIILIIIWLQYYEKLAFTKIRKQFAQLFS